MAYSAVDRTLQDFIGDAILEAPDDAKCGAKFYIRNADTVYVCDGNGNWYENQLPVSNYVWDDDEMKRVPERQSVVNVDELHADMDGVEGLLGDVKANQTNGTQKTQIAAPTYPINEFGENAAVVSGVETTILSYVVPVGSTLYIQGFYGSSGESAVYRLKKNGTAKGVLRTSPSRPTEKLCYQDGVLTAVAGDTVIITAKHAEILNQVIDCGLWGYL